MHISAQCPVGYKGIHVYCVYIYPWIFYNYILSCQCGNTRCQLLMWWLSFIPEPLMGFTAVTQQCGIWLDPLFFAVKLSWMVLLSREITV